MASLIGKSAQSAKVGIFVLLKSAGKFSALPVAASRAARLGSTVATVGFPNIGLQGFAPKVLAHGHQRGEKSPRSPARRMTRGISRF